MKSSALRRFAHFEQSLFARLVRLGVPAVTLDAQGRARESLAKLYAWRYSKLDTLNIVKENAVFARANAGLAHTAQLIDVPDYAGQGETAPTAHFFQNLGEAEYVVALYMYMRVLGYPASSITLLATYNGQKELLRDVVKARCAANPLFGWPAKITTVDKYQGQQNDYVLLSLVRTRHAGHLRDVRRLVVAMSRARLGLYVFCRVSLFSECEELKPAFDQLRDANPSFKLALVRNERYGETQRAATDTEPEGRFVCEGVEQLGELVA